MTLTTEAATLTEEQQAWLDGASSLIGFLEANPDPWDGRQTIDLFHGVWSWSTDDVLSHMGTVARRMAPCEKSADEQDDFRLTKHFGPHAVVVYTARENVCTKRVVGVETKEVEDYDDETKALLAARPKVTRAVEVERVEWDCPSLLGGAK